MLNKKIKNHTLNSLIGQQRIIIICIKDKLNANMKNNNTALKITAGQQSLTVATAFVTAE